MFSQHISGKEYSYMGLVMSRGMKLPTQTESEQVIYAKDWSDLLLGLPVDLVRTVLGDWLSAKDIVMLDTAACSKQSRDALLSSLKRFKLRREFQGVVAGPTIFRWLLRRKVVTDALDLTSGRHSAAHKALYMLAYGHHLEYLCVGTETELHNVLMICPNLKQIENIRVRPASFPAEDVVLNQYFSPMVDSVQLISKQLRCCMADVAQWQNLRHLDLTYFESAVTALQLIVLNNPNLERITLKRAGMLPVNTACQIIARGCPKLRFLDLGRVGYTLTNVDLALLAEHCPNLDMLDFYGMESVACYNGSGVRCLMKKCAKLSTLMFTDVPIPMWDTLYADCSIEDTLPVLANLTCLSFMQCKGLTTAAVTHFLAACPALTELRIVQCVGVEGAIVGEIRNCCPNLKRLHMVGVTALTEPDRLNLWLLIPRLRELWLDKATVAADPKLDVALQPGRGVGCRIIVQLRLL